MLNLLLWSKVRMVPLQEVAKNNLDQHDGFPRPGSVYYGHFKDPNFIPKSFKRFKTINKFVVPLYRIRLLPLLGAGSIMYVMTTKGRKTGKKRRTPLELTRIDNELYGGVSLPKKSQWLKNIQANPDDVWVQIGFRSFHAKIEFLNEEESINYFKWYSINRPSGARIGWGWNPKRDDVEAADFSPLMKIYKIFRILRYDQS